MANLKATTFDQLLQVGECKLGNNTWSRWDDSDDCFVVTLHQSDIVKVFSDHVEFTLAGWNTVTTRERVNQFLPRGVGVSTVKGQPMLTMWDVNDPTVRHSEPFSEFHWLKVKTD